jgi:hypothetical protein
MFEFSPVKFPHKVWFQAKPSERKFIDERAKALADALNESSAVNQIHSPRTMSPTIDPYHIKLSPNGFVFQPGGISETRTRAKQEIIRLNDEARHNIQAQVMHKMRRNSLS